MQHMVYVKTYKSPNVNKREIMRYAGVKGDDVYIQNLIDECLNQVEKKLDYRVCYTQLPVKVDGDTLDLTFAKVKSKDLAKNLKNCNTYVLFCATVGIEIDRLVTKYSVISPTKALVFQAIGAERIESLCNQFNICIADEYKFTKPRFSAGYGDFDLKFQRAIFDTLNCSKSIGVTLNESLLMSPSKSVTAIIGICDKAAKCEKQGCDVCDKSDCEFRREQ